MTVSNMADELESHPSINQDISNSSDNILHPVMMDAESSLPQISSSVKENDIQFSGPRVHLLPPGHLPSYRAVFLIANAALGAGMLNFPQAYLKTGSVQVAISMQFGLLFFIIGAFLILARCANYSQAPTYQDAIYSMLGSRMKKVSEVLILLYFFGSAITYIIIIGEQMNSVLSFATNQKSAWYIDKRFCFCIFAIIFLLPLVLPKQLKALSYTSFFGGVGAFFITFVIVLRYFDGTYEKEKNLPVDIKSDWKDAFGAIPVICFGFQCHVSSVAVYAELKNRSIKKFFSCAMVAMVVCSVTYSLSGSFGLKTFGSHTDPDILENYHDDDVLVIVARVAIVFILMSSFSIVSFCARTVIEGLYFSVRTITEDEAKRSEPIRRTIETLCWFVFVLLLAAVVPDIGVAISMIGGIASLFIFFFPGLCLFQTVDLRKPKLERTEKLIVLLACIYLVVGVFIFGEVTTLAIMQQVRARHLQ